MQAITIGSAFSGACDGVSLGLEWAGLGPTIWQIEIEDDRRENLARHWPDADRSISDIRRANASVLERPDILACSAPCKDLSSAGKKVGLSGDRSGLWYEAERLIGELLPSWVVVENVGSGAINWVPHIRQGLERFGYSTLPIPITAGDCGAPHERSRIFVLAHLDVRGKSPESVNAEVAGASAVGGFPETPNHDHETRSQPYRNLGLRRRNGATEPTRRVETHRRHEGWPTQLEVVAPIHGVSSRVVRWLGDSVVPQCAEVIGWVIRELEGIETK